MIGSLAPSGSRGSPPAASRGMVTTSAPTTSSNAPADVDVATGVTTRPINMPRRATMIMAVRR